MAISSLEAAYEVCRLSNWTINHERLNALLYLLHLYYLGEKDEPLIDENFRAWFYRPMLVTIYLKLECFHGRPIQNVFYTVNPHLKTPEILFINEKFDYLIELSDADLFEKVKYHNGALDRTFREAVGEKIDIPNTYIKQEYMDFHQK